MDENVYFLERHGTAQSQLDHLFLLAGQQVSMALGTTEIELGPHTGAVPFEPCFQPFWYWLFFR
jgi:hypothetical protein